MFDKKPITVITAPSCAGKDYLSNCLFEQFPGLFQMAVSCTTRPPREGEVDGKDYNFLSLDEFKKMDSSNRLLESVQFGEKCYGTSASEIERIQSEGRFPVLIVEPVGALNIWNWCNENNQRAQFVFIDVDRKMALKRFLDRFLNDYSALLEKVEDEFISDSPSDFDFDKSVNDLIINYSKRIYLSLYEESSWGEALPYHLRLGKMLNPEDSVRAAEKIKRAVESNAPGVPDQYLSKKSASLSKKSPRLNDMDSVIKKTLNTVKKEYSNSSTLQSIILKCENERLNQIEFNL